jgi:hypothetical protein
MDIQFWIWLIVVVVTVVSRMMKKSRDKEIPGQRQQPEPDSKPVTFEDLLREIQESKRPQPVTQPVIRKPVAQETRSLERVDFDDTRSMDTYEQAKRQAFQRPSLEETLKLADTDLKFGHFKQYDEISEKSLAREILQDFKSPDSFQKAFIMSEILKRKF